MTKVDIDTWRRATALVHEVPMLSLAMTFSDGRRAEVSHEAAFAPLLPPCLLRLAVLEHRADPAGSARWLADVVAVELGGPFVEERGDGVVRHRRHGADHHTFVTPVAAGLVLDELGRCPPPGVAVHDGHVHVRVDDQLGVVAVHLRGFEADAGDLAARWFARRLRAHEPLA